MAFVNKIAEDARLRIVIDENLVPVNENVRAACEILGLDPLHVACEGRFVAFVAAKDGQRALEIMKAHNSGTSPARIGDVHAGSPPLVVSKGPFGVSRFLDVPSGEQLPRIC